MTKWDKDLQILLHIIKYCERIKKVAPIFENDFNNFQRKPQQKPLIDPDEISQPGNNDIGNNTSLDIVLTLTGKDSPLMAQIDELIRDVDDEGSAAPGI